MTPVQLKHPKVCKCGVVHMDMPVDAREGLYEDFHWECACGSSLMFMPDQERSFELIRAGMGSPPPDAPARIAQVTYYIDCPVCHSLVVAPSGELVWSVAEVLKLDGAKRTCVQGHELIIRK